MRGGLLVQLGDGPLCWALMQVGATTLGSQAAALQVEQLEQRQEAAVQEMQAALQLLRGAVTHTSEQVGLWGRQRPGLLCNGSPRSPCTRTRTSCWAAAQYAVAAQLLATWRRPPPG